MFFFYFCTFWTFFVQIQAAAQPDQVIELFRHGARGPITSYDPQWSQSELGQLTVAGMVEQYNLGKKIATNYPNLVASGYNPADVYVLADNSKRCIESAMVQASSIFRGLTSTVTQSLPKGIQDSLIDEYESSLLAGETSRGDYVAVNVDVVGAGSSNALMFTGVKSNFCQALITLDDANAASTEMKNAWTTFQTPIQEVNAYLSGSRKISSLSELPTAYDPFICDIYDSKTLPGGITDTDLIESLCYGQEYYQHLLKSSQNIQRELISWNTLKAIKDQLVNFRKGNNAKKLVLYGGHDTNIDAVLSVLDVINADCLLANYDDHLNGQALSYPNCLYAKFAYNLIFEFYNDTTNPYIQVKYNDVIVPLCSGQDSCSYDDFMTLIQDASGGIDSVEAWNEKCGNDSGSLSTGAKIGIAIGAAAGFSIIIGIGVWFLKKKTFIDRLKPQKGISEEEIQQDIEI